MNYIAIFTPKIVLLLAILFSAGSICDKVILLPIWFVKLIIDYDSSRPSHQGKIYQWMKDRPIETVELVDVCIRFILMAVFCVTAILLRAWVPFAVGAIGAIVYILAICSCVREIIVERRKRREK